MSNATDGQNKDHIDVQHQQTEVFQSLQPIAWASGAATWSLQLVMRDKPNVNSPVTVDVWSQSGTCTVPGAVPATQRYASATVNLPIAVDMQGIAVGIAGTGAPQHVFAASEALCMAVTNPNGGGSSDVHAYSDTFSTSGLTGRSSLFGPFSFATAPYLLHQQAVAGSVRSMSTSSSGQANDEVTVNAGNTVVFQSTSPIKDASGLSPWPLLLVIKDPLALLGSAQGQVWKQTGACTTYASAPAASRFASASFPVPTSLSSNNGVSAALAGTGSSVTTLGVSEVLCLAVSNTGVGNWKVRLDTPSSAGVPGKSSLGGPVSQVAGVRAFASASRVHHARSLLPLCAALVVLAAGGGRWWHLIRRR